ncbi:interferon-induced GTP-binding protein Mx2 [Coniochaeta sp. 2T2.1]|nr:interferon-induced GTP-binding protein Mx2 [Coniochaeta sp. 2T2.1]
MGSLASGKVKQDQGCLGNQALLDKIDKLRALNIGADIPLPQLVVVGDQSSGKSSVLESLTGFSFPRAAGLCTRYATQITCRREAQEYTDISIIPRPSANEEEQKRLRAFSRRVEAGEDVGFAKIFEDANREMGIRALDDESTNASLSTFSDNVLKLEICGPDQVHLTVIDVPGIFRTATPGLTTEADIELVRTMVKNYMKESRTIILAVIPCKVDIATQEILELAKVADPQGLRTMGVLTQPDLAIERATQQAVIDLVMGKRNDLKLGYCVVKNRDADDQDSSIQERHDKEKVFFCKDPWSKIAKSGRTGVDALKERLRELLLAITKKEFPNVKAEILDRLKRSREQLEGYGDPRSDAHAQRSYLSKLSMEFQKIATCAVDVNYVHSELFDSEPELKLATQVIGLNERFAWTFWKKGHARKFKSETGNDDDAEEKKFAGSIPDVKCEYPELGNVLGDTSYVCPASSDDSIMERIRNVYADSRGPELGTFGGAVLAAVFKEQAMKWKQLVVRHISQVILKIHHFIVKVLEAIVPNEKVCNALWDEILFDKVCAGHMRAMSHALFLHRIECKLQRLETSLEDKAVNSKCGTIQYIPLLDVRSLTINKSNAEQVEEDIHDLLMSYYKVSRKRFVDAICQQCVDHFLLFGADDRDLQHKSPLKVFDAELVMSLDGDKLEAIAGEDPWTKQQREALAAEIKNLVEATRVLRG